MQTDIERLRGTWNVVALEMDGQKLPASASLGSRILIDGNRFTTIAMGATYEGTLEVDAAGTPRTFDLIFTAGPETGNRSLGIYELDDDAWKICLTVTGSVRPTEFATAPGSGLALEVLKRATAAEVQALQAASDASEEQAPERVAAQCEPVPELEGEWSLVSCVRDGVPLEPSLLRCGKRVDRGNAVTVSFGPQVFLKAWYQADPVKEPKTIDFIHAEGSIAGQTQLGIYERDGQTLRLCYSAPRQPRPEDYATALGDGRTMAVWKLIKK